MFVRWLFYGCGVLNISININRKRCAIARKHNMNPNEQQVQKIDATHTRKKIIFIFSFTEYKNITIARYSRFFWLFYAHFCSFSDSIHVAMIFLWSIVNMMFLLSLFLCARSPYQSEKSQFECFFTIVVCCQHSFHRFRFFRKS